MAELTREANRRVLDIIIAWLRENFGDHYTDEWYESLAKDLVSNLRPVIIENFRRAGY